MQNKKNQDEQEAPCYRMSRDIETVPDLWREWTRGIDGAESVRASLTGGYRQAEVVATRLGSANVGR